MTSTSSVKFQFPEVRIVEASAGSGKTFALAKRYVQLLLGAGVSPETLPIRQILAITFTNKSAVEMKQRILTFLKNLALNKAPAAQQEEILSGLTLTETEAQEKSHVLMDAIIGHYNFFQVQTIDSFINSILSGCAFRINLSANFKIRRNEKDYLEQSLDQLIEQASGNAVVKKRFEDFLHQYLFLEQKTGWFPKKDILIVLQQLFKTQNDLGGIFVPATHDMRYLAKARQQTRDDISLLYEVFPEDGHGQFRNSLENFVNNYGHQFPIDKISDYFYRPEFPIKKGGDVPASLAALWERIGRGLRDICETESFAIFNCYLNLFAAMLVELDTVVRKEDILFLSQLNNKARALFDDENITVEELYYRLASRFRHYLIDEFQDTSLLQWRNLEPMVEEALATGGTLYYVGDKKQAIYGFRGGEAALFDGVKARFSSFPTHTEVLSQNWRSRENIVEFNNLIFSKDNLIQFMNHIGASADKKSGGSGESLLRLEDREEILSVFKDSQQAFKKDLRGGYVSVERIAAKNQEELHLQAKDKLLSLVRDLRLRFRGGEIAVLARDNSEVELITSWLLEAGILIDSERTSNVKENPYIKEIISFLKFLDSPVDNLSFASFLLGDIFQKASGLALIDIRQFLFECRLLSAHQKDVYLYKEFRDRYPLVWEKLLEDFFRNAGIYPMYELVVSFYFRFGCVAAFPQQQGFFMRFLEIIRIREEESVDLLSFLEYLEVAPDEELYVNIARADNVRVQTVHKSKGLEYPVVILPFLQMDISIGRSSGTLKNLVIARDGHELRLALLRKKYTRFSLPLLQLYREEFKSSFLTELNNVYVGLTRAKEELYIFVPEKSGLTANWINLLLPEDIREFGDKDAGRKAVATGKLEPPLLPTARCRDWMDYLREEFVSPQQIQQREEVREGEIIHYLLSWVGDCSQGGMEEALFAGEAALLEKFPYLTDGQHYRNFVEKVLQAESYRQFFQVPTAQIFREQEMVDVHGLTKRIDRLMVWEKEVWVVDYKMHRGVSGPSAESNSLVSSEHVRQVEEYMALVKELYPRQQVRGFLLYLTGLDWEEVSSIETKLGVKPN